MRRKLFTMITVLGMLAGLQGCSGQKAVRLEEALVLYRQNNLEEALPMLEQVATRERDNADAQAWLAETYRRLDRRAEAVASARRALALEPCHSFAHTVIADAVNPVVGTWEQANADTTWTHIMEAIRCDSGDGNAWLLAWEEAIHHGYPRLVREASVQFARTGFLTPTALAYGRWMLRALPRNAILITNGDMDTFPPCAVQEGEGSRNDVTIVNRNLLNTTWYARFLRDHAGVTLPFDDAGLDSLAPVRDTRGDLLLPSDQIFRAWVGQEAHGELARPIRLAVTVDRSYFASLQVSPRYAGAFVSLIPGAVSETADTAVIRAAFAGTKPDDFAGPWVSDQDRSPVRRTTAWMLHRNLVRAALALCDAYVQAGRLPEGASWLAWARRLADVNGSAEEFRTEFGRLEEAVAGKARP